MVSALFLISPVAVSESHARMMHRLNLFFIILVLSASYSLTIGADVPCNIQILFQCGENEICNQKPLSDVGTCQCQSGYGRIGGVCVSAPTPATPKPIPASTNIPPTAEPHTHSSSKNAVVAGIMVPLLLLCVAGAILVYFGRKLGWMHRLRQLRPMQRTNDVLIGRADDDDDPIA